MSSLAHLNIDHQDRRDERLGWLLVDSMVALSGHQLAVHSEWMSAAQKAVHLVCLSVDYSEGMSVAQKVAQKEGSWADHLATKTDKR